VFLAHGLDSGHGDADQNDEAVEEVLPVGVNADEQHAVGNNRDDRDGGDRAEHGALAAEDARAAQDDGRDDGHFSADQRLRDRLARHADTDHADEAGNRADGGVQQELDLLDVVACALGRHFVAADGVQGAAEHRLVQDERGDDAQGHKEQEHRGHGRAQAGGVVHLEEVALTEGAEADRQGRGDLLELEQAHRDAGEEGLRAERDDHSVELEVRDDPAVEHAEDPADHDREDEARPGVRLAPAKLQADGRGERIREGRDGRERKVEAAGYHDDERAHGEHAVDDHRAKDGDDRVRLKQLTLGNDLNDGAHDDQNQKYVKFRSAGHALQSSFIHRCQPLLSG